MIELDEDQEAAVTRMVNEPTRAALNASQYGTGKTVVTVEVAKRLGGEVNLIIAPLFTKYSWKSTILGQVPGADVRFINSTKQGKENLERMLLGEPGWYIVGREYFRSKQDQINQCSQSIDFAAYDECQAWANHKSLGFKKMKGFKPGYRMALSATPARNKFHGLYAITQWLWPKLEGHASFWKFVADHCITREDYFSGTIIEGEKVPGSFVSSLPCYIRLEKDFGEPIEFRLEVELSVRERKIYDQIEKTMIAWLEENPLIIKFPHTKRIRLRQVTLGTIAYDPDEDAVYFPEDMYSTKYNTLVELMKEYPDEPMLIFVSSQKFVEVVTHRLQEAGFRALPWHGKITEKQRHNVKDAFVAGEADYIVATIASIGEGVDGLQHRARMMVWLERHDDNMLNMQAFRRLFRRGQERQVVSIDVVALDTFDEGVLASGIQNQIDMNKSLKKGN